MLVERRVQSLPKQFGILFLPLFGQTLREEIKLAAIGIVRHAIVPDQTNIVGHFVESLVLLGIKFLSNQAEIHGFLDDLGIINETESFVIDLFTERF